MEITTTSDRTAMRSRCVAPNGLAVKGGVRLQAAADATFPGAHAWSPLIT